MSERIKVLREKFLSTQPSICAERAVFVTEAYKENKKETVIMKRAKATAHILKNMKIFIRDKELVVGNQASRFRAAPIFPEYAVDWIIDELSSLPDRAGDKFLVDEETEKTLRNVLPWWVGNTVSDRAKNMLPQNAQKAMECGVIMASHLITSPSGDGHIVVDFKKVLRVGLKGVCLEAETRLEELDLTVPGSIEKREFLQAVIITCEAVINFAHRYELLALELYNACEDEVRKVELLRIIKTCALVPENPPETFYQAVQSVWFIHLILQIESNGHSVSLGRLDQYLYSFYKKALLTNNLTKNQIVEILECLWLKLNEICKVKSWTYSKYALGYPTYQNITLGGVTQDGKEAVNDLTFLCLEAEDNIRLPQPNLSARYNASSPQRYLLECAKLISHGYGMPAMENDDAIIPSLLARGVSIPDANNYAMVGCIEVGVPGKWGYRPTSMSYINMVKLMEMALNGGKDHVTGICLRPAEKKLGSFGSFDEVLKVWKVQVEYYTKMQVIIDTVADTAMKDMATDAFCSALVNDCIKRGKSIKEGGAVYDLISGIQIGIANVANSFMAMKKLVFEEKVLTEKQLKRNLKSNFHGTEGERIRQILLNKAPKFGNDSDVVDYLAADCYMDYINNIEKYQNARFGLGPITGYFSSASTIATNVPAGFIVNATPDGRKAGEPLADGSSPTGGTDVLGPTAVIKSVCKLPINYLTGGQLLNIKLSPECVCNETGILNLISLIRAFGRLKGWHIQFNIISAKVLKNAQLYPEKYKNLQVRVSGYCALFTTLDRAIQNDIICRTQHSTFLI